MNAYDKFQQAYIQLLEEAKDIGFKAGTDALTIMQDEMNRLVEDLAKTSELSREELNEIGDYLKKDLEAAAEEMEDSDTVFHEWLNNDLPVIEETLKQYFLQAADPTNLQLMAWRNQK